MIACALVGSMWVALGRIEFGFGCVGEFLDFGCAR